MKELEILGEDRFPAFTNPRSGSRAVIVQNGKLLVVHESRTGWWQLPRGGTESGETPEECCIRETEEETGLIIKPVCRFLTLVEYYAEYRNITCFFTAEVTGREQMRLTDTEARRGAEPVWLPVRDALVLFARHPPARKQTKKNAVPAYGIIPLCGKLFPAVSPRGSADRLSLPRARRHAR